MMILKMNRFLMVFTFLFIGCAAEWDYPKVPQRNPETGKMESKYVYFPSRHKPQPVQITVNPTQR